MGTWLGDRDREDYYVAAYARPSTHPHISNATSLFSNLLPAVVYQARLRIKRILVRWVTALTSHSAVERRNRRRRRVWFGDAIGDLASGELYFRGIRRDDQQV
jgi:hypothetical protein